jgi:hypothetical protein
LFISQDFLLIEFMQTADQGRAARRARLKVLVAAAVFGGAGRANAGRLGAVRVVIIEREV